MKLNIIELRKKNNKLKTYIENFELSHININNCFNEFDIYWNSPKALNFYKEVHEIKKDIEVNMIYFCELSKIYSEIINKYSKFGNDININLKEKNNIIKEFDNYIEILNKIKLINKEISNYYSDNYLVMNKIEELILISNNIKRNIYKDFIYIEEIEEKIKIKCNNLIVKEIEELNYNKYIC